MSRRRKKWLPILLVAGLVLGMIYLFTTEVFERRFTAERMESNGKLFALVLSMHTYHDIHNQLPPLAIRDTDGKPLLSWRVALLPYIEHGKLYEQFKLDEPWDSEHNIKLLDKMPRPYRTPWQSEEDNMTHFQVFVGPGTPFERDGLTFEEINAADGLGNTFLVVEAREPVPWTKPADLEYDPNKPLPEFYMNPDDLPRHLRFSVWPRRQFIYARMGDGKGVDLDYPLDEDRIRAMITWNGGEEIEW